MLLIDVGNTRLKWSLFEPVMDRIACRSSDYLHDNMALFLESFFVDIKPQEVWISCVAGEAIKKQLSLWFSKNWGIDANFVQSQKTFMGLTNSYPQVTDLGVDRWLAMLAAWHLYRRAVCVIDCGTAITMDVVNQSGDHQGGLILPGLQLMQQSLQLKTSAIKRVGEVGVLLASDTESAVGGGCHLMVRKGVASIFKEFEQQLEVKLLCALTGGDGELLKSEFKYYEYREDLVLFGLYLTASQQS